MSANFKKWRESATLLLVAKQTFWTSKQPKYNNYKILTMKRSSKSSFMPDTHVFPGGTLDKADCSNDWFKLYQKFGISDKCYDIFKQVKYISPIFENVNDSNIPKYISLRICAIRETFEECGVLLCKSTATENTGNRSLWASNFDSLDLEGWQKRVHKDPNEFIELCETFQIYPDIWSLHEWSNWLTPSGMPKRFDTIFFLAAVQNIPTTMVEKTEVQHIEWAEPKELLQKNYDHSIFLPPPQFYELSRLVHFSKVEELAKFSLERSLHGCERILPYRLSTEKNETSILPGDELYPGEKEAQIPNEDIIEEIPKCEVMHRVFHPDTFKNDIIISNYTPFIKHVLPVITKTKNNSKL